MRLRQLRMKLQQRKVFVTRAIGFLLFALLSGTAPAGLRAQSPTPIVDHSPGLDQGYFDMYNVNFAAAHKRLSTVALAASRRRPRRRLRRRSLPLRRVRPPAHHRRPALRRSKPLRQPQQASPPTPPYARPSTTAPRRPKSSPTPRSNATQRTPGPSTPKRSSMACVRTTP